MKHTLLILSLLFCFQLSVFAQNPDTLWYDKDWDEAPASHSTFYGLNTLLNDSIVKVQDYYKNGTLQMQGQYLITDEEIDMDRLAFHFTHLTVANKRVRVARHGRFYFYKASGELDDIQSYYRGAESLEMGKINSMNPSKERDSRIIARSWYKPEMRLRTISVSSYHLGNLQFIAPWEVDEMVDSVYTNFIDSSPYNFTYLVRVQGSYNSGRVTIEGYHPNGKKSFLEHYSLKYSPKISPSDTSFIPEYGTYIRPADTTHISTGTPIDSLFTWSENSESTGRAYYQNGYFSTANFLYDNGQLKAQIYQDKIGKRFFKSWYRNGEIKVIHPINQENKPITHYQKFAQNGQLILQYGIQNNRPHGKFETWYENGKKASSRVFENGFLRGETKIWYENGQLQREGNYRQFDQGNGRYARLSDMSLIAESSLEMTLDQMMYLGGLEGTWRFYQEDGTLARTIAFKKGKIKKDSNVTASNTHKRIDKKCAHSFVFYWHKNLNHYETYCGDVENTYEHYEDSIASDGTRFRQLHRVIVHPKKVGEYFKVTYQKFNGDSVLVAEGDFSSYDDGMLQRATTFLYKIGTWKYWNSDGNLITEEIYSKKIKLGRRYQYTYYYPNGTPLYLENKLENTKKAWYSNGKLKYELVFIKDQKRFSYKEWRGDGSLLLHYQYLEKEVKDGIQYWYDEKGQVIASKEYEQGELVEE